MNINGITHTLQIDWTTGSAQLNEMAYEGFWLLRFTDLVFDQKLFRI